MYAAAQLDSGIAAAVSAPIEAGRDGVLRRRWAYLLHCPPRPAVPGPVDSVVSTAERALANRAARILAAGPLTLIDLAAALDRTRGPTVDGARVADLLRRLDLATPDTTTGRWTAAGTGTANARHIALLRAAAGTGRTVHSTAQLADLLRMAGYTNPTGGALSQHPLIRHLAYNRWQLLGSP